jgi:sugar transferase EpsL
VLKRTVDQVVTLIGLVVLSPVLAIVGFLVWRKLGWPILFRQERLGLDEQTFRIIKFRTMTEERGADGALLPDADRLTPFGEWLRACSLDELPELWNVLRGDMSVVGPRPLPATFRDHYLEDERDRHSVKPGVTGWAQVNGRNSVHWEDRFAMDVWYARHHDWWLDLRILARTPGAVFSRKGISADGHATMPPLQRRGIERADG